MPVEEAIELLLRCAKPVEATQKLALTEALGRVLAEDIHANVDVPPMDNSAMDGYALRHADFVAEGKTRLAVSQRICAGQVGVELEPGTAARIFTGAPVPPGADTVVMQEMCCRDGDFVTISSVVPQGKNIRKAGEDIAKNDVILGTGQALRPQEIGLAASVGVGELSVYRKLRVGIFTTGDELCEPGKTAAPGQIYNSNRYTMTGMLQSLGCEVVDLGVVEDTLDATRQAMLDAVEVSDLIMTSGGVSVGEEDYIRIALEELGQLNLWRINVKPGKPLAFGEINGTPFLGMPGNPVSVFATFCIFARPFIKRKQGHMQTEPESFMVAADFEWKKKGSRCEYIRARVGRGSAGEPILSLFPNQGSGVLTSTSWANGLAIIPPDTEVEKGIMLEFIPFGGLFS
jgi:molybdopterin molybdotransferase